MAEHLKMSFHEVMDAYPFQRVWERMQNPADIDSEEMFYLSCWHRPSTLQSELICYAFQETGLLDSQSLVRKALPSLKFNGKPFAMDATVFWLEPGYAILSHGKKKHRMALRCVGDTIVSENYPLKPELMRTLLDEIRRKEYEAGRLTDWEFDHLPEYLGSE